MRISFFRWVFAAALLAACAPATPAGQGKPVQSQTQRDMTPNAEAVEIESLVEGNNAFALDFYQHVRTGEENQFFSPYSLSTALGMVFAGARGDTEAQVAEVMHYPLPQNRLHPAFNALDLQITGGGSGSAQAEDRPFQLSVANALWGQDGFEFLPEFLDLLAINYGAGLRLLDFQTDPESARLQINDWVAQNTRDRIKNIIPPGGLSAATRLALANAIFFKADWLTQFEPTNTRQLPFNRLDGTQAAADFMSHAKAESLLYSAGEDYQVIELSYQGGEVSMLVLLPATGSFPDFEAGLTVEKLDEIIDGLKPQPVRVILPKFEFDAAYQLAETMSNMGMPDAFCSAEADFSGMDGRGELCIGQIFHKAFVAMDEKGTEAAAASVAVMEAAGMPLDEVIVFQADRPFIFLIRHNTTGSVLFMGRLTKPQGK